MSSINLSVCGGNTFGGACVLPCAPCPRTAVLELRHGTLGALILTFSDALAAAAAALRTQGYDSGVGTNASDAELYPYNAMRPRRTGLYYY